MTISSTDAMTEATGSPVPSAKRNMVIWWIAGVVILVIIVVVGATAIAGAGPFQRTSSDWTAVFLSDNEVYFGHVKYETNDDIDLVNVAYLQKSTSTAASTTTTAPSTLSILGLVGNQIQCPTDEVLINRHNVINVQVLQSTSFVVTRLQTLSQTAQKCFQPSSATPAPAPAPSAKASAKPSPSTSPRSTP